MGQWFNGGFLTYPGVDASTWELLMFGHHYTNAWAMPGDSAWNTAISHPCAKNSTMPDRVIFQGTQWTAGYPLASWQRDWTGIIDNIKTKWPSVKRIELMLSTVAPGDVTCPGGTEQVIPAVGFMSLDTMQTNPMFAGLVFEDPGLGQHFEVPKCSDFVPGGPQYANNAAAIMDIVDYYGHFFVTGHL